MTASILTILECVTELTGYINSVRYASKEQQNVAIEASNLYGILTNLRFRIEAVKSIDDPWFRQLKALGTEHGLLSQMKSTLEDLMKPIRQSNKKRDQLRSALTWNWTKTQVVEALARMERFKSCITLALSSDHFALSQAAYTKLNERLADLHLRMQKVQTAASQTLQDSISRWLGIPDPSTNFQAALELRHENTG